MQSIKIIVEGLEYDGFTSAIVTKSIEHLAGTFNFEASIATDNKNPYPIKIGDRCVITIQDRTIINGFIEKIKISFDADSHSLKISGRDKTADIIDSQLGTINFTTPISLKRITEQTLKALNINNIKVIDNTNSRSFTQDVVGAELGTTAFDFLEKYAKKRQTLLTVTGDGDLLYFRGNLGTYTTQLSSEKTTPATILSGDINYNNSKRFHEYVCVAQDNPSASTANYFKPAKEVSGSSVKPKALDNNIRNTRVYNFEADFNSETETLQDRAKWESNFRRSQAKKWMYTIDGHFAHDDNDIWKPGYLVHVIDPYADLDSLLLISTITYKEDDKGTSSEIKFLTNDAFTLEATKAEKDEKTSDEGVSQYFTGKPND